MQTVVAGRRYRWTKTGANETGVAIRGLGLTYQTTGAKVIPVTEGKTYRWACEHTARTTSLVNGASTYLSNTTPRTFVAEGSSVTLNVHLVDNADHIDEVMLQTGDFTAQSEWVEMLGTP